MQSSFDVLEWESTSKTQDSLVHQLFGDISTSKLSTCSAVLLESTCSATQQVNASKGEKRKTLKNEESTSKLKKTKQNKRQKNKFKQVQQLSSERSETTINKANEKNIDVTTAEIEGPVLGHMASEKPNGHERKKEKKGRKSNETKEKDVSSKTAKKNVKTTQKSNSQLTEDRGSQSGTTHDDEVISIKGTNQRTHIDSVSQLKSKSSLQEKMTKKLESSRFRWINEKLYTTTGDEAVAMFSKDPNLFDVYHRGFTNQVKLWPVNPVDKIIEWLKKRSTLQVVADFGCGEAIIAQSVANKVHSFDLVAKNKYVTACNMAKVPLSSTSVDVAVFCLSLMGTNLVDFLREAHRVLKPGGILKVAEVASRISDTAQFTMSFSRLGFKLQNEDTTNKMFVLFDFIKSKDSVKFVPSNQLDGLNLKPCIYKKR